MFGFSIVQQREQIVRVAVDRQAVEFRGMFEVITAVVNIGEVVQCACVGPVDRQPELFDLLGGEPCLRRGKRARVSLPGRSPGPGCHGTG